QAPGKSLAELLAHMLADRGEELAGALPQGGDGGPPAALCDGQRREGPAQQPGVLLVLGQLSHGGKDEGAGRPWGQNKSYPTGAAWRLCLRDRVFGRARGQSSGPRSAG